MRVKDLKYGVDSEAIKRPQEEMGIGRTAGDKHDHPGIAHRQRQA
jgi:hypothetical protein